MRAAVAMVSVVLGLSAGVAALDTTSRAGGRQFEYNIAEYISLRRLVEQRTGGSHITNDHEAIGRAADRFADAIRAARLCATCCDIFTPTVAREFRRRPCNARAYEGERALRTPIVHDRFDWQHAEPTPPALIAALPPLPDELQYRLVNCDLVLVDVVAGLVIDVVPRARPVRRELHRGW